MVKHVGVRGINGPTVCAIPEGKALGIKTSGARRPKSKMKTMLLSSKLFRLSQHLMQLVLASIGDLYTHTYEAGGEAFKRLVQHCVSFGCILGQRLRLQLRSRTVQTSVG